MASDGPVVQFRKDGTVVGSIFSSGGQYVGLGSGDVGLLYLGAADDIRPWNPSTNLARDNAIDLGNSDARFKDFYIAGDIAHKDAAGNARLLYDKSENLLGNAGTYLYGYGVYLGGTGSSNLLDDYEEGTFTPTLEGTSGDPTVSYGDQKGSYVKVGRIVHCTVQIRTTSRSGGAGNCRVGGFPFTCNQSTVGWQAGSVAYTNNFTSAPTRAMMQNGLNSVNLYTCDSTSNPRADHSTGFGVSLWANTGDLYFAISYETNS